MEGRVANLEAHLRISFRGPQAGHALDVIVDTGFTGHLALDSNIIDALGLESSDRVGAKLADGTTVYLPVHTALIEWNGFEVEVDIVAAGDRPLLGTGLLAGWEFRTQFIEGGLVTVRAIEQSEVR